LHRKVTLKQIEALDPKRHKREDFSCGVSALDHFLKTNARKEAPDLSVTFALTCEEEPGEIIGYYSLNATNLQADDLPPELMKKLGCYGVVPATLLGRLAVAEKYQRSELRVGELLLTDAMLKAHIASKSVASFGLIVDVLKGAKGDPTGFYKRFGFIECIETRTKMFIPMKTITQILKAAGLA
jgi:predicted N-acetyltransferase YhbS